MPPGRPAPAWGVTSVIGTVGEANHDYSRSVGATPVTYGGGLVDRNRVRTMVSDEVAKELGVPLLSPGRSVERLVELTELYEQDLMARPDSGRSPLHTGVAGAPPVFPLYCGGLPCLREGRSACLVRSIARAAPRADRVSAGSMTSSTRPRSAA